MRTESWIWDEWEIWYTVSTDWMVYTSGDNYVTTILGGDAIERECERACEPPCERPCERERRRQRRLSLQSFSSSKIHFLATSALSSADDARMSSCPWVMRDATI